MQPFHLAVPVHDVTVARQFYKEVIGCTQGRSDTRWVDFDLFGHQFVIHQKDGLQIERSTNPVDGHDVPIPHFGVVLEWQQWHDFADRLKQHQIEFVIEPCIRFEGQLGEQATMFFLDPSGNALEFKAFKDPSQLFAT